MPAKQELRFRGDFMSERNYSEFNVGDKGIGDTPVSYCDTGPDFLKTFHEYVLGPRKQQKIRIRHSIIVGTNRVNFGWVFGDYDNAGNWASYTLPLPYCGRFYMQLENNTLGSSLPLFLFRKDRQDVEAPKADGTAGSSKGWQCRLTDAVFTFDNLYGKPYLAQPNGSYASSVASAPTDPNFRVAGMTARVEFSVVPNVSAPTTGNPTITVKIYNDAGTTAIFTMTTTSISLADATVNAIEFGVNSDTFNLSTLMQPSNYWDIEVWSGVDKTPFGPYVPDPSWSLWNGTTEVPLTFDGYIATAGATTVTSPVSNGTTGFTNLAYPEKVQSFDTRVEGVTRFSDYVIDNTTLPYYIAPTIYLPDGTPPDGGWPVVLWAHSGFFIGGSKYDIVPRWCSDMLDNGFAVITVDYRVADQVPGHYQVQWPDLLLDYKRHLRWVDTVGNTAPFYFNPAKKFATGYSAGGHLALMAAVSRNVTNDGAGRNLKLSPTQDDPTMLGAFVYAAPVDLQVAINEDSVAPIISTALQYFFGSNTNRTGTAVDDLITASQTIPIAYCRGTGDLLLSKSHPDILAAKFGTGGTVAGKTVTGINKPSLYQYFTVRSDHDEIDNNYDSVPKPKPYDGASQQLVGWMRRIMGA